MTNVKGKWALVTGASRGLGKLSAQLLADYGCNLILHSRDKSHCENFAKELEAKGIKTFCVQAELDKLSEVDAMLREIDGFGVNVEIVLNNAGLQIAYRTDYLATPANDYEVSFRVNTISPMMICYHFMPKMIAAGFGRIVNVTSGIDKDPQQAGYSASKAALDKVTKDLGTKVEGTDVMINLADPGWCRTDLGGQGAPNAPESALPGLVLGIFADDKKSGRIFSAQEYAGKKLEDIL